MEKEFSVIKLRKMNINSSTKESKVYDFLGRSEEKQSPFKLYFQTLKTVEGTFADKIIRNLFPSFGIQNWTLNISTSAASLNINFFHNIHMVFPEQILLNKRNWIL